MLNNLNLNKTLFIDIETVSAKPNYKELDLHWQQLWEKKANYIIKEEESIEDTYSRAAIYAEFGKVICISLGFLYTENDTLQFRVKSFYGHNEKELLTKFVNLLNAKFNSPDYLLCAHNGKEFDFPYLGRRILINGLKLPYLLDIAGRKPWEVQHLDTLQLWKFGDYKHYTSLELLSGLFNIESPKQEISGADVGRLYWEENKLKAIVEYCENDVIAVVQLLLSFKGMNKLSTQNITRVNG